MDEYPISRMYTDSRVQRIYGGSNEIMRMLVARAINAALVFLNGTGFTLAGLFLSVS